MTRIAYIYSRLPRTHSLSHFHLQGQHTLSILTYRLAQTLTLSIAIYRDYTLSFTFRLTETVHTHILSLLHFDFQQPTPQKCIHSATFFFLVLPFRLDFFQPRRPPQKFRQTPKETTNQHGRRHVPPRTRCYISIYRYLT